jgi:ferrous iron transport protein B
MKITIALAGNQNCGKTTLFNQLTGSNQHVGNFPGVTVERKSGMIKPNYIPSEAKDIEAEVVDLPGIYSLSPYTPEEIVTRDFLLKEKPDCIINIIDATNVERNLYLSLQLAELQIPMVLAFNMMDEVLGAGNSIDIDKLSAEMQLPIVPISAVKGDGVSDLVYHIVDAAKNKKIPAKIDFCSEGSPVHQAIHSIAHLIADHTDTRGLPNRFCATKLVEGDELLVEQLGLNTNEKDILGHITREMEKDAGTDREAALADMRYAYISRITRDTVHRLGDTVEQKRSIKIDNILTGKYTAIPIFLAIMALIFWLTFGVVGNHLSEWFSMFIQWCIGWVDKGLTAYGMNPVVKSLIVDGVCAGVGSVLGFMPTILVLFFFLALLEDTGYMARIAFVMDTLLRKIGLSGKSFVPMLIGFGCSVPAIMSTRTLTSKRDKKMTIFIIPFMSCSAKIPVYALFTAAFFPKHGALVMVFLYLLGFAVAIISALCLKGTMFKGKPVPFVLELPAYRMPSIKNMFLDIKEKARDFLKKAFTIILGATIVVWFLTNLDYHLNVVTDPSHSLLAAIGSFIAPIFKPLGFNDWRLSTALITGLTAKETVVSTLGILLGASGSELTSITSTLLSVPSALGFLTFTLLYMPCVAALAVTRREIGRKGAIEAMVFQTATAYVIALIVFHIAALIF